MNYIFIPTWGIIAISIFSLALLAALIYFSSHLEVLEETVTDDDIEKLAE